VRVYSFDPRPPAAELGKTQQTEDAQNGQDATSEERAPADIQPLPSWSDDRHLCDLGLVEATTGEVRVVARDWRLTGWEVSPDGRAVAAGGAHPTVRQWDATTGRLLRSCAGHPGSVSGLAYSGDGRRLLTSSQNLLLLFDAHKGAELRRLEGHKTNVNCLAFAADGRRAYSGSGTYLYKDGKIVFKDGKYVYTDCVLRQWDAESGREMQVITSHTVPLYSLAVAPDGRELFSGALEPVLRRWHVAPAGLGELPPWQGSSGHVWSVSVAPDGQALVTSGLDGKVIVWDLITGKRLHEWALHENIGRPAFASDSRHLAIPLATGVIYVLRLEGPPARKGS
jgi:WD40 repeat protein